MSVFLKIISFVIFLGWIINSLAKFSSQPVISAASIVLNTVIFIGIWKGLSYTISHPESSFSDKKSKIIRWVIVFFFSIYIVQISVLLSFILRFIIDLSYMNGSRVAISIVNGLGLYYSKILTILGLLISTPLLFLVNRTIKFSKPYIPTIILFIVWSIIIFIVPLFK